MVRSVRCFENDLEQDLLDKDYAVAIWPVTGQGFQNT